jgi:hypothetical protein
MAISPLDVVQWQLIYSIGGKQMDYKPASTEYDAYFEIYIKLVPNGDLFTLLQKQLDETIALLAHVPEDKIDYRYAPGKWSLKEVVGHMIDTERIMSYRALRIGHGDTTPLPGFDQDFYVENAGLQQVSFESLIDEFSLVRQTTIQLFKRLPAEAFTRKGSANQKEVTTRALSYIIIGHSMHHCNVIAESYLN